MRWWLGFLLLALAVPFVLAQEATPPSPPNPCLAPEQQQLSFWLGEWDLTWPGEKQGAVDHGTNSIQHVLDGCVIEENFSGGT
ncbi:MAG TPA: hypothetical protein VNH83_01500, partial [Bryobacteraceae bacterium]|nr:hypothetical protein [Bryobacteraceae bacterium]